MEGGREGRRARVSIPIHEDTCCPKHLFVYITTFESGHFLLSYSVWIRALQ